MSCWAQESSPEAILRDEEQRWRSQQEMEMRQRQLAEPDVNLQSESISPDKMPEKRVRDTELPKNETPCYQVNQFVFEIPVDLPKHILSQSGTTLPGDTFYFLSKKLEFARGQCIGIKGIGFLVDQLLLELMQRGYTTTRIGVVRNQDLSTGVLKFSLLPGFVRTLRFNGDGFANIKNAFPIKIGDLLNIRNLEQGLEQVERMHSLSVSVQLEPGDAPGESDIVLMIQKRKPWRLVLSLDDSGTRATGRLQSGVNFGFDNPLGLNDSLTFNFSHDVDMKWNEHGSRAMSFYYTIPWGNWTFAMSGSQNQLYFPIYHLYSSTERKQLDNRITYMFWRNQVQKNSIEFRVSRYLSETSISDQGWGIKRPISNQSRNMTFAELSYIHRHHFGPARLDLTASYRWGVPWLGADSDGYEPSQRYNLKIIDATLNLPFILAGKIAYYTGTLRGQITRTQQESSNYFAIGSRWTVRGFDDQSTLSAEQGYFLRNEIQIPLVGTRQSIYYGVDVGSVFGLEESLSAKKTIMGLAIGLRGALFKDCSYDVYLATPIYQPQNMNSTPTLGFSLRRFF